MIRKLIDLSIANRGLVLLLTAAVAIAGVWSATRITVDAIPDLSDVQVVIRTEFPGQAPQIIEDQVTYPLTTAMLAVPLAKVVRGYSMFGSSFVYVIFEDGTDMYWARSRVLEQLSVVSAKLPAGATPQLGPDATGVGWIFQYALVTGPYCPQHPKGVWLDPATGEWYGAPGEAPEDPRVREHLQRRRVLPGMDRCPVDGEPLLDADQDLADLRSIQDWYLRLELSPVEGVSEVASVGGFVKQYQVVVDPVRLLAYGIPIGRVAEAIRRSNIDVGGRLLEMSETEFMVRGVGYLGSMTDAEIAEGRRSGNSDSSQSPESPESPQRPESPQSPESPEISLRPVRTLRQLRTERVLEDLRRVALGATIEGTPINIEDVAEVRVGPEIRRGIAELDGEGEVAAGIVVMRYGENARTTIDRVRRKLAELEDGLPPGVAVEVTYDRSDLIDRAVGTLTRTLAEEILVVSIVTILFLLHARSALVAILVLPVGVLTSLAIMHALGMNANIMSLGGIAIAIGVMVDSSVVMVDNVHKHLEDDAARRAAGGPGRPFAELVGAASREVGPSLFFSLLILTVSFFPVFVLGEQSGRLFKPLAYTKSFAMAAAALLAVTVTPVLMASLIRDRVLPERISRGKRLAAYAAAMGLPAVILLALLPGGAFGVGPWWLAGGWVFLSGVVMLPQRILREDQNPLTRLIERIYEPAFALSLRLRWLLLPGAVALVLLTIVPLMRLGSEFMPPLEEGDLLYMPTADPGLSVTKARELLQQTDKLIAAFPEVAKVFGKIGRAETATDPAPLGMIETTITLHRDASRWRQVPLERFYSGWPSWASWLPRRVWPETRPISLEELVYGYDLPGGIRVPGLNDVLQIPGLTNSWTMPIRTRIDMLSTGIKTPVGVKVMGPNLSTLARLSEEIAQVLKTSPGTGAHTLSAFPEKSVGGYYLDVDPLREEIARYGLLVGDVQDIVMSAMGGMNVSFTVEGRERYPINVRYPQELRDSVEKLERTLVAAPSGAQVPLGQLAAFEVRRGPPMVKSENARPTSWVFVDIAGIDVGTYVARAKEAVEAAVRLPDEGGYTIIWSGQYEYMERAKERLAVMVPLSVLTVILLLYMATRSWGRVALVIGAMPFSVVGAIWALWILDYNLSIAVWVGIIALVGLDTETSLVMLMYLDVTFDRYRAEGRMRDRNDLWHAVRDGAVRRIRPKTMTVLTTFVGLLPLLWATGAGADTMRRLAVPMLGGLIASFAVELFLYPSVYYVMKRRSVG